MELLPLALLNAALVLGTYYFGKWMGGGECFKDVLLAYKQDKELFCKALEKLIEENDL